MSSSCLTSIGTPRIAVIGAGVSGALCAQALAQAGAQVELFDKARGPGGRMATRRHGEGAYESLGDLVGRGTPSASRKITFEAAEVP